MNYGKKKLIEMIAAYLLIIIFFILFINYYLVVKIKAVSQEYLASQKILAQFDEKEKLVNSLRKQYQEIEPDFKKLENVFLDVKDTVGFITDLEKVAQSTNNFFEIKSISSFELNKTDNKNPFLGFHIAILGDFSELISFLANLEDSPYPPYRLIEITNLDIKKLGKANLDGIKAANVSDSEEDDLESSMDIKIYIK